MILSLILLHRRGDRGYTIEETVGSEVIHETGYDDTFYYFGNERQIRDWPIV